MPNFSKQWLIDYERKRANQAGAARVSAIKPEPAEGHPLVSGVYREKTSGARFEILFTVYAVRPCDWDGWHVKPLQDMLVEAGLLPGDAWHQLEGRVRSRKVSTEGEERTEIEITPL